MFDSASGSSPALHHSQKIVNVDVPQGNGRAVMDGALGAGAMGKEIWPSDEARRWHDGGRRSWNLD
jgi:hypothetical protein